MSRNENINDIIDDYHAGEIPGMDFQKQLKTDAELQQEFELYQKDMAVIRASAKVQLKEHAALALSNNGRNQNAVFPVKWIILIGAIIVLLVAGFFFYHKYGQPKTSPELYAAHFELLPPSNDRSNSNPTDIWQAAMADYANQDFNKAIEILKPVIHQPDFKYAESGKLYLGLSYMMVNENQNAIDIFGEISAESSFVPDAEWYMALAFLKMNKIPEAKAALQKIVEQPKHFKQEEAGKILSAMGH
ncbi:MAG: tetratricopeptide repeat protein [Bacteroidales bacterium]|nr:tetratricopeptide repeat protein [Bacteroidales bacterium]MCF8311747.1 tetratricopeptide repeat protein [Saprospiraceae bacterium]